MNDDYKYLTVKLLEPPVLRSYLGNPLYYAPIFRMDVPDSVFEDAGAAPGGTPGSPAVSIHAR